MFRWMTINWAEINFTLLSIHASKAVEVISIGQHSPYEQVAAYLSRSPWIFPGVPLNFNGAPGNIQGDLAGM